MKFVSMSSKKLQQLNIHKALKVSKKSVLGHFKDFNILMWHLNMVENAYEVFSRTERKSNGQLVCRCACLFHLSTQTYSLLFVPFLYHGNLSGSYCINTSYLSYISTFSSLSSSSTNFLWTSFVFFMNFLCQLLS